MQQRWRRRMAVLVMLPVLLLAGVAQASVHYLCAMDGQVRKLCCCETSPAQISRAGEGVAQISRGPCCDTESRSHEGLAPATSTPESRDAVLAAAAPIDLPVLVAPPTRRLNLDVRRALAPPDGRPSLLLQKSSLLI